jgi:hypothetical protein
LNKKRKKKMIGFILQLQLLLLQELLELLPIVRRRHSLLVLLRLRRYTCSERSLLDGV